MKRTNNFIIVILANLVLLTGLGLNARAQGGFYEMRCRGGDDLFRIDDLGTNQDNSDLLLGLNFTPATKAAGADSGGLEPGTCSWIDRPLRELEPQQIQFFVKPGEAEQIAEHLQNPDNYWSFLVSNTNRGYYETRKHRVWKPDSEEKPQ